MKKEKYEIPLELDAAIMQYASEKKFRWNHWYLSVPARAAAIVFIGAVLAYFQFADKDVKKINNVHPIAEVVQEHDIEWSDFEAKMEFISEEIFVEAKYLAQL